MYSLAMKLSFIFQFHLVPCAFIITFEGSLISFLLWVQQFRNRLRFICFIFSFINSFISDISYHWYIFFQSLVNDTFSNLKLNLFIINGFICSNKYLKQVVWINHSWISPTLQRGWGFKFCLFSKKCGRVDFSHRKGRCWLNSSRRC